MIRRLLGADRPKVIAIVVTTRAEQQAAASHAATAGGALPLRIFCAEDGATASTVLREMRSYWPALTIVAWTGEKAPALFKLTPFVLLPFRVVAFNEAGGFFPLKPGSVASHARRRIRDRTVAVTTWIKEQVHSLAFRAGQQIHSAAYRSGERIRDVALLIWCATALPLGRAVRDVAMLGWNALLAGAAFCVQPIAPLTFHALQKRAAVAPSVGAPAPALNRDFIEVELPSRAWRRKRFLRALEKSSASFVVLHRGPVSETDRRQLMDMAVMTNAFAAARQEAFTGWRKQVVSKHPFRILQPGEVTQVVAPWSSLVVVRRDLLLQLGAPFAITTGAALMMLYAKATAAGWSSFVVGTGANVPQEPAMPLEDLEFVLRGARPFGLRGNVAMGPAHTQARRDKLHVLVVSPYLPFPMSHGGAVRIYSLCSQLCDAVDFTLVCFREVHEAVEYEQLHKVFRTVHVVDIDEKSADAAVPSQVAAYRNSAVAELMRRQRADIVQLEYTQMAEYRKYAGSAPTILVEHDITFTLHRQISQTMPSPAADREYARWRDFEREALQGVNAVWTMSADDNAVALEHGARAGGTWIVRNGVDLQRFTVQARATSAPTILFVGSFRHLPNLLAYELLYQAIMPLVWSEIPDVRLHVIAGPLHEKAAVLASKASLLATDPRVVMEGFVSDVRDAYRECDVVAIPVPISAGTNVKVMEAMACGRACVSTIVGCQGLDLIDGEDVLVRDDPQSFASAMLTLLRDNGLRNSIARRARRTVEERFGWDAIARTAMESYGVIAAASGEPAGVHPERRQPHTDQLPLQK